MAHDTQQIIDKLDAIKSDLQYIKHHITDLDVVLTDDDIESLKAAEDDLRSGRTKRLA
jgi:uncharacterized membrane protein